MSYEAGKVSRFFPQTLLYDSVGQRAAKLTVLKVWPCRESKLEFETKTLNAQHPGLGYSALQCLY